MYRVVRRGMLLVRLLERSDSSISLGNWGGSRCGLVSFSVESLFDFKATTKVSDEQVIVVMYAR